MEEYFVEAASIVALLIEAIVVLLLAAASWQALYRSIVRSWQGLRTKGARDDVWLDYSAWIVLALTFALAADIIRSAIAPSWDSIGKLAAIAVIRMLLNLFLMHDVETIFKDRERRRVGKEIAIDDD